MNVPRGRAPFKLAKVVASSVSDVVKKRTERQTKV